ncbi:MAG: Gfo/Idh/MocA family oxidoreductase [bacterium]
MDSLKAVVVGAGGISGAWFPQLKTEGVEVAGVVDLDPARATAQIQKHGLSCEAFTSLRRALRRARPDFVVDLTIPDAHCKVTCTALHAGCHVIGEKPMAASMAQARRMVRTAEKTGRIYMVSQSRRYEMRHAALRQFLASKEIGGLTSLNCAFFMGCHFGGFRDEMPSPLILDMSIHHFDLARMLSGADPVAVYAREYNPAGSWYKGDVAASCVFEMTHGVIFTYSGSWCAEGEHTSWHGDWRLQGTTGSVLYERDQVPHGAVITNDAGFNREKKSFEVPDIEIPGIGQHGALKEFLAAIRGGPAPQGECHDNIKSLAMVFAAIESSHKGRRVLVK